MRRINEGTSAILLQSGLDEKWSADSMECYCYLRDVRDLLADGKTRKYRDVSGKLGVYAILEFFLDSTSPLQET